MSLLLLYRCLDYFTYSAEHDLRLTKLYTVKSVRATFFQQKTEWTNQCDVRTLSSKCLAEKYDWDTKEGLSPGYRGSET